MRTLLSALMGLVLCFSGFAEVIWSPPGNFSVDPPEGWTFVEDPTPEHFAMTDPTRTIILEIFSLPKGEVTDLADEAKAFLDKIEAKGPQQTFEWNGQSAWIAAITRTLALKNGPLEASGFALVADHGDRWVTALAYTPTNQYEKAYDRVFSALNSLALGEEGRRTPGALSVVFGLKAEPLGMDKKTLTGVPSPFTLTYDLDADDRIKETLARETRLLIAQVGAQVKDQSVLVKPWSRFYRQIYRDLYSSLTPLSDYWRSQVDRGKVKAADLPQTVLSWLQKLKYDRKGGLTDISTPWQTLKDGAGDCDSRSLVYLALMEQLGVHGVLMVSAVYSHGMAALDLEGQGARFPFGDKNWLVAELTDTVNLGMIGQKVADPNQWIGVDLWGKP